MRIMRFLPGAALALSALACSDGSGPGTETPEFSTVEMTVGERRTVPGLAPSYWSGYTPVAYVGFSLNSDETEVVATGAGEDTLVDANGTPRVRVVVTAPPAGNRPAFVAVDVGHRHACALTADGAAYCWGAGGETYWAPDALHPAVPVPRCDFSLDGYHTYGIECTPVPVRVADAPPLVSLDVGAYRTCGLTAAGASFCWGKGYGDAVHSDVGGPYVALGAGVYGADCGVRVDGALVCVDARGVTHRLLPDIAFDTSASSSTSGPPRACALDREGVAYCWGYGPLGDGAPNPTFGAEPVRAAGDLRFTVLAVGPERTCALTADGRPYCWGTGVPDATGQIPSTGVLVPTAVPTELRFSSIATTLSTCGLTAEGAAYCWDAGGFTAKFGNLRFRSLSLGLGLGGTCGILVAGDAVCWGPNEYGLTGVGLLSGTTEEPTRVAGQLSAP
jgi:hypothetical protein